MNSRTLCIATLVGCFGFSFSTAGAAELADIDLSKKPLDKPTLDYLHENNVQIPQTEYDDEGNLVESGSILAPESAYALTEVPAGADGAAPVGDNIITKFNYNSETGEFTPVYYQMNLKQTEYGDPNGDVTLTFGWQKDEYGDNEFVQDPTAPIGQTITYKYNSSATTTPDGGSYTAEYINQVQPVTLENPDSTSSSHYPHIGGVSGVTNFENVLFKDNNTNVTLTVDGGGTSSKYSYVDVRGGALNNSANIDTLSGAFINNSITSTINEVSNRDRGYVYAYGGALYNSGEITNITGDFINNNITSNSDNYTANIFGGAIYNSNKIGNITGNFIGNYTKANQEDSNGGAIYNTGEIGDIHGSFIGNYASSDHHNSGNPTATGGAINNEGGKIGNIIGDFINNFADGTNARGAAIYNDMGTIGNITGDFINNSVDGSSSYDGPQGSAIYNDMGIIGNITGNFINNNSSAIYITNSGKINNITGDFIGNETGIDNTWGYINNITGNFIGNENTGINNSRKITSISGDFINNEVGIVNEGYITNITGDFVNNTSTALSNSGKINDITGDFINNSRAISNSGSIGYITGNFYSNNQGINTSRGSYIEKITGNFIDNNGAISIGAEFTNQNLEITGNFIRNNNTFNRYYNFTGGGAIYTSSPIGKIKGNFVENKSQSIDDACGGAIYVSDYFQQYLGGTDGIHDGRINLVTGDFTANEAVSVNASATGGAIRNDGHINEIVNSSFYNNAAIGATSAQGGAIYTSESLNIIAQDGGSSIFSGNYVQTGDSEKDYQAIFVGEANDAILKNIEMHSTIKSTQETPVVTLNANTNGTIRIDDKISGTPAPVGDYMIDRNRTKIWLDEEGNPLENPNMEVYSLNLTGDETGKIILNNTVDAHEYDDDGNVTAQAPVNISLENTNLYLGARDNIFDGNNLTLKSGMLSMINGGAGVSALNTFTVTGDTKFVADVDLANQTMDRITADTYGEHTGNLNIVGLNLLSDAPQDRDTTEIFFAETGLMDNVVNGTGELPDSYQTAYTPIYKYNVGYETREDDGGYFVFTRGDKIPTTPGGGNGGGSTGNPSDAFNPSVLATPVGNLAAGQAAMNEAFKYVFEHADAFTQLPSMERYAKINVNKYALSTDFNENMPSYADQLHNNAVWFRPYTTFETMNIKNGPKVDAITYGSLVGFDGDFKEMKNGWSRIFTGYAGYMGSSLNYSGVDTTMNGGLLGFTETFYKGNFWTAITASAGASVGESHTMYGKEDYTSLLAGVGSKTGYNFEFKDGKFIIQPIMFLSYTFVNTFDYKNAAGVSIESDPLHTIQLNPSVRFIANLKGGWQPYASVGMVWNLMNESKVTANNVKLPEMSVKPYVEYGVGVQRNWADKFTAFLQAMIRNGGRNGVALTGGFRFMLGSDSKNSDKPKVKKEIKSL